MTKHGKNEKYKLLARIDLGEPTNSTPAVADGVMYLRTLSHLMALCLTIHVQE